MASDRSPAEAASMDLREVLRTGGVPTIAVLGLLNLVDEFDRVALAVLAPDIQRSLGLSDTALGAVAGLGGLVVFIGAIPLGYVADRVRRTRLVGVCSLVWATFAMVAGLVQNAAQLAVSRLLNGLGKANVTPVHNSLIADTYPIDGRARVYALHNLANPIGAVMGPLLAGAIASIAGGPEGWRWAFVVLSVPAFILALVAFRLPEPARGRFERQEVAGEGALETSGAPADPIPLGEAWARLRRIRTYSFLIAGVGAFGIAAFAIPTFFSLLLEDRYGLDAWRRGNVQSATQLGALAAVPVAGHFADRLFRRDPTLTMLLMGGCLAAGGLLYPVGLFLPRLWMTVVFAAATVGFILAAFVPAQALVAAVVPYRMRATGFAFVGIYLFLVGGLGGAIGVGAMSDAWGERTALAVAVPASLLTAGALIALGSRSVPHDIAAAAAELRRSRAATGAYVAGAGSPILSVADVDVAYGSVRVVFGVSLEVREGETLALLGTNGAGKSTLLKAIAGLLPVQSGSIAFAGRDITTAPTDLRVAAGIVQLSGGNAVFPTLSVRDNLRVAAFQFLDDRRRVDARLDAVLDLFPALADRLNEPAGSLSGGEQQMVALAKALIPEPRLLIIDELSLGLAPVMIERLLEVIADLKAGGLTMLIVEQSLNIALAFADRAVFMEKGEVRFDGDPRRLVDDGELVRAVFLGGKPR